MLVMNCAVDMKRVLASPSGSGAAGDRGGGRRGRQQRARDGGGVGGEGESAPLQEGGQGQAASSVAAEDVEKFHPVSCATCGTEVWNR